MQYRLQTKRIRNFVIISHIDHGKSTLADRLLELTGTVAQREMKEQYLDQMELEREKGITIKLAPVRMEYKIKDSNVGIRSSKQILNSNDRNSKQDDSFGFGASNFGFSDSRFILNLIDTPGHVDFSYEVSRSLACVEGAILLIDATSGIQAQTLSNLYLALEHNLEIIPVVNKIDLPNADVKKTSKEISDLLGCPQEEVIPISAKYGTNVEKVLEAVIKKIPPPRESKDKNFRALIFDSIYNEFKGVVAYIRVFNGEVKEGDKIKFFSTGKEVEVEEVGIFKPKLERKESLKTGEIGYLICGLKDIQECRVGDTLASLKVSEPLPGYKEIKPMVFANFYPENADDFLLLSESLAKLKLNDYSLYYEPKSTPTLGRGFLCGFLGLLHLEIIQERLKREFGLKLVITTPSVSYKILLTNGKELTIFNPSELPEASQIREIREPWVRLNVITPVKYQSQIFDLVKEYRGVYRETEYLSGKEGRLILIFEMPLSSIIVDFYGKLKSISSGFASMSYDVLDFRKADLVKLDILVAGEKVDAFSRIVPQDKTFQVGRNLVKRLKELIPRQNFQVSLQAAVGGKIIAREDIRALRKDVTAKLYGGDVTRKMKLLEKQKKGKKKMKMIGKVKIPQEVFLKVLKKE